MTSHDTEKPKRINSDRCGHCCENMIQAFRNIGGKSYCSKKCLVLAGIMKAPEYAPKKQHVNYVPGSKLSNLEKSMIRTQYKSGAYSHAELGRKYGVHKSIIFRVIHKGELAK